jgi:integrase
MGMPGVTSDAFRKTVATLMDEAGLSARSAADQLGHAKPSVTQDVYYGRKRRATGAAQVLEQLG